MQLPQPIGFAYEGSNLPRATYVLHLALALTPPAVGHLVTKDAPRSDERGHRAHEQDCPVIASHRA